MNKILIECPECGQLVPTPKNEGEPLVLGPHFKPPGELAELPDEADPLDMQCPASGEPFEEVADSD